jgi:hypothetical protein
MQFLSLSISSNKVREQAVSFKRAPRGVFEEIPKMDGGREDDRTDPYTIAINTEQESGRLPRWLGQHLESSQEPDLDSNTKDAAAMICLTGDLACCLLSAGNRGRGLVAVQRT